MKPRQVLTIGDGNDISLRLGAELRPLDSSPADPGDPLHVLFTEPDRMRQRCHAWAVASGMPDRTDDLMCGLRACGQTWQSATQAREVGIGLSQVPAERLLAPITGFDASTQAMVLALLADAYLPQHLEDSLRLIGLLLHERYTPVFEVALPGPPTALARLFSRALAAGLAVERVRGWIARHRPIPEPTDAPDWPWPLRVSTLGRFEIVRTGEALPFAGKPPKKALELLQALVANGGRDVPVSLLIRQLWPDEDSVDMKNLFDNTLHRLRKLITPVEGLVLNGGKLTLDPALCWVDVWSFLRLSFTYLNREDAMAPEAMREAQLALRLYAGDFLQSEGRHVWTLAFRDRVRSRCLRLVRAYGQGLEGAGQWDRAIALYERALEIDSLNEGFYRRLIVCRQQLGQHAEALGAYERCRHLFSIVLGIAPSAQTERIASRSRAPQGRS